MPVTKNTKVQISAAVVGLLVGLNPGNTASVWAQVKGAGPQATEKPDPATAASSSADFDKHLSAGIEAAKNSRWDVARQEFLKALELKPDDPEAVARLAQTEIAMGKNWDAVEHLELFLRRPAGNEKDQEAAKRLLGEARSKLATVTITVDKPGAKVTTGDRVLGNSPLEGPVSVDSGHQRFDAEGPGGHAHFEIDLKPGSTQTINLELKAPPPKIIIKDPQPWRTPILLSGLGLSVAGIGIGTGFIIAAVGKNEEASALGAELQGDRETGEDLCPPPGKPDPRCDKLASLERTRDTWANVSLAGYVVGGAAVVGTIVTWVVTKRADTPKVGIRIIPSVNGFVMTGIF